MAHCGEFKIGSIYQSSHVFSLESDAVFQPHLANNGDLKSQIAKKNIET